MHQNRPKSRKQQTQQKGGLACSFDRIPSTSPSRRSVAHALRAFLYSPGDLAVSLWRLRCDGTPPESGNPARDDRRTTMSNHDLFIHGADGAPEPATPEQILAAARQVLAHRVRRGASLSSPQKVREYLTVRLGHLDHEVFGIILADQRHRVIEYVELFRGTIDGASVYPREVVKLALEKGAAACVLLHNHPSGVKDQSQADELITKRVAAALALIDVRVLDHVLGGFWGVTTALKIPQLVGFRSTNREETIQ
jgi:DNA repair protein RadC